MTDFDIRVTSVAVRCRKCEKEMVIGADEFYVEYTSGYGYSDYQEVDQVCADVTCPTCGSWSTVIFYGGN